MNFHYKHIVLWLKNGRKRQLDLQPNKVNVITGGSNTGKSAILEIIDYCLFASKVKIAESIINENVAWYGIVIAINDKEYTICRTALVDGKATQNYHFSSVGDIPDEPTINCDAATIRELLEKEFSIDSKVAVPFGGYHLKAGSKFSLRYFLMFTTISQDIITNSSVFFDKQNIPRYREALERIFDLAIGIDTIGNILSREKKSALEAELKKHEHRRERFVTKQAEFRQELNELIRRAKEYELIPANLDSDESLKALYMVIDRFSQLLSAKPGGEFDILKQEENTARLTIRNLEQLSSEYRRYKASLKNTQDSLKPIEYLEGKKNELVQTSIFADIVYALKTDLSDIKEDVKTRTAIDRNISDLIADEERKIERINEQLAILPQDSRAFNSDREKYFFMGQLAAKLDLYSASPESLDTDIEKQIKSVNDDLKQVFVSDVSEQRNIIISLLEEFIQKYIGVAGDVLENYKDYHPQFDYKGKTLSLRKPYTDHVDSVGSSSNHLFLHLFLFLGFHELVKTKKVPYIPSYLIIDQPSRPYWGEKGKDEGILKTGDESKILKVFELLNIFMVTIQKEYGSGFQMIVMEHVPADYWKDLEHVCLVEEFIGGNALIRPGDVNKKEVEDELDEEEL